MPRPHTDLGGPPAPAYFAYSRGSFDRRWQEHLYGEASRTTRLDPPVGIAYAEEVSSFSEVRQREAQIKRWSRGTKEALVSGDAERLRWLAKSHDHRA
ncbi:MAG: GIY-YIG nuclease family protein [Victivallales bacterium]|nr:GIY-YIG nuclease family protein [Victivallales bacterium]